MSLFKPLEQLIYFVRNSLWAYPELLFFGPDSLLNSLSKIYINYRPYSHFLTVMGVILSLIALISTNVYAFLQIDTSTYIEGVIVGVDSAGDIQKLHRVSPLINTNVQLEKDLSELIYESLIRVNQNGEIEAVLADYVTIEEGKIYQFKLRDNLYWQDGEQVTTEDVQKTFELVQSLDRDFTTSTIYSRAASKIELKVLDELSFQFELQSAIPGFFEAISFKILPAHLMGNLNVNNIASLEPVINRKPIGTGPYELIKVEENTIILRKNKHYREPATIENVHFRLFPNEQSAVNALKTGQIHALSGISDENIRTLQELSNLDVLFSNVLYNQYWGFYFNLAENGPEFFKDKKVRQAISSAINRDEILEVLLNFAEEAKGPIPPTSFAYSQQNYYSYNLEKANQLLNEAGWVFEGDDTVRTKSGTKLSFELVVINNPDREKVAEIISRNLKSVGVEVTIITTDLETLVSQYINPKQYQALLFGVETFIDPDRYELFHSSQVEHPGLNITSYVSPEQVLAVVDNDTKKVPKVDDALDDARKVLDRNRRKVKYDIFQAAIAEDVPIVFLFYPKEVYVLNARVKDVSINDLNSLEERFRGIIHWKIALD